MADSKLTALTADTAPVDADLVYTVDDVAGTPTSKKVTLANFAAAAPFSSRYAPIAGSIGGPPLIVRKTADESVTSSTTLQNDDHLLFAIGASEVWKARIVLRYSAATDGDLKVDITAPSGATGWFAGMGLHALVTDTFGNLSSRSFTVFGAGGFQFGGSGEGALVLMELYVVNSTNAGNVQLQWAQGTSSGTATTLTAGSNLEAHRFA